MNENPPRLPWWALAARRPHAWVRTVVSGLVVVICLASQSFGSRGAWIAGAVFFALLTIAGVATIVWLGRYRPRRAREDRSGRVNRAAPDAGREPVRRHDPE